MCDSSFDEDLERYRRNNVELAVALNDLKADLSTIQLELVHRNRELQRAHAENAALKQELANKDNQLKTWRLLIMDLVHSNTQKYSEIVNKLGLAPAANTAVNRPNECPPRPPPIIVAEKTLLPTTSKPIEQHRSADIVQRRQKDNAYDFSPQLSNLTEESFNSQLNESKSLEPSPDKNIMVSRRRASVPPAVTTTPPLALRKISERMVSNGETNGRKPTAKIKKMDQIIDENTPNNGSTGRPTRKTAPKNLSEPKLGTKLRRN